MPAIRGPGGGGVGDIATAPCRTGLPLNLLGSVAAVAATGACFAVDRVLTFARNSAFSFSILSSRAITSSSVADRAAPLKATRHSAAQAVPARSPFFMNFPVFPRLNSKANRLYACHMPDESGARPGDPNKGNMLQKWNTFSAASQHLWQECCRFVHVPVVYGISTEQ